MDKIHIQDLEVFANHGVFLEENALGQKFILSAILYTDTRKAGMTDDLSASIHYGEVSQMIHDFVAGNTFKLLESVVECLAIELLTKVENLNRVWLEIQKPWAPVHLPLKTVSVEIERGWHKAYIALGSNMGDKLSYLEQGLELLEKTESCRVIKVSDFISTVPYGYLGQDNFLNGCLELDTLLTPEELLERLHTIELEAQRERKIHWGPRTLDLDIIFYDDLVMNSEKLIIPHIEMHKRNFVLRPLNQLAPWKRHPLLLKTVEQLMKEIEKL